MPWFEDHEIGAIRRFGRYAVTADEIVAFARRYDPQPFHLDEAAGKAHPLFRGLTASGWHVCSMAMAMLVAEMPEGGDAAILGAAGIDELRWLRPVHPGDVLSLVTEVVGVDGSRAEIGVVRMRTDVLRQSSEPVCRFTALMLARKRP